MQTTRSRAQPGCARRPTHGTSCSSGRGALLPAAGTRAVGTVSAVHGVKVPHREQLRLIEWPGLKRTTTLLEFQPPCYVQGRQPPDQAAQSLALNAPRDGASTASLGNLRGSDQMPSRTSCFVFPLMLVCTVGEHNTIPPRAEEARQGVPGVSSAESMNCYTTVWWAPSQPSTGHKRFGSTKKHGRISPLPPQHTSLQGPSSDLLWMYRFGCGTHVDTAASLPELEQADPFLPCTSAIRKHPSVHQEALPGKAEKCQTWDSSHMQPFLDLCSVQFL